MARRFVITGTDTEIGKTVLSAGLVDLLDAHYGNPIQAGLRGETDSEVVKRLAELPDDRIVPER
ncbi:AAA family ATPase, partial [Acinetobacter baumannii]